MLKKTATKLIHSAHQHRQRTCTGMQEAEAAEALTTSAEQAQQQKRPSSCNQTMSCLMDEYTRRAFWPQQRTHVMAMLLGLALAAADSDKERRTPQRTTEVYGCCGNNSALT
jgi:hypothetical protein